MTGCPNPADVSANKPSGSWPVTLRLRRKMGTRDTRLKRHFSCLATMILAPWPCCASVASVYLARPYTSSKHGPPTSTAMALQGYISPVPLSHYSGLVKMRVHFWYPQKKNKTSKKGDNKHRTLGSHSLEQPIVCFLYCIFLWGKPCKT